MNLSNFFAKQKLSRALLIAFGVLLGIMIVLGAVSFFTLGKVGQQLDTEFTKDIKPSIQILEAEIAFNKAEAAAYRYILAGDNDARKAALNRLNLSLEKVKENLGLAEKKMLSEKTKALMATVQKDLQLFIAEVDTIKEYVDRGKSSVAASEVSGKQFRGAINELDKAVQEIVHVKEGNIEKALEDAKQETFYGEMLIVILIIVGAGVSTLIGTSISKGLNGTSGDVKSAIEFVAKNDLTKEVPNIHLNNEIGDMAKALFAMQNNLKKVVSNIKDASQSLSSSSTELSTVSTQVSSNAEETTSQATAVASAATQVSANVQSVAAGVEELTSNIREVASNAAEASAVANEAVSEAKKTTAQMEKLGVSSQEISSVLKVISSIAEQTNLLALNATIEAARAGELGKGFAVVANEVKELARQTAKATEEIGHNIGNIQVDVRDAVASISNISVVITKINDISGLIASAVEEQAATAGEIGRNISSASDGSNSIASNINSVADASRSTSEGASNTQKAANELAKVSEQLTLMVSSFKV